MRIRADHVLLALMAFLPFCSPAQSWTPTSAPTAEWRSVAVSADGTKLVAASGGIWISTNSGSSWTPSGPPDDNGWHCVASSAEGTRLAATAWDGIYISADSGNTWTKTYAASTDWQCLAMSADGLKIAADPNCDCAQVLTSSDGGMTWVTNTVPDATGMNLAWPGNGTELVAPVYSGQIFASTNLGASWVTMNSAPAGEGPFYCFASSANGSVLVAGGEGGLCVSTNFGGNWISNTEYAEGVSWPSCAASADGSTLMAAGNYNLGSQSTGFILISTNSGVSWTPADVPIAYWSCVASSADGQELVASAPAYPINGGIYLWHTTPSPTMNLTRDNNHLLLSWPVPSAGFVLQQNSDWITTNWTDATNTPVLNLTNLLEQVTLPLNGTNCFYRLAMP